MHRLFPTSRWLLKNHLPNLGFVITSAPSRNYTKTPDPSSMNDLLEELKASKPINPSPQFVLGMENNFHQTKPSKSSNPSTTMTVEAQISHPWPEWVDLMVLLLKEDHFDAEGNPFQNVELGPKESNHIRTACLNFARDRNDVIRC